MPKKKERYSLLQGIYGMYVHDSLLKEDIPLQKICDMLNQLTKKVPVGDWEMKLIAMVHHTYDINLTDVIVRLKSGMI
ncbi:MAG: hypothetical protein ACTSPK_00045 [Candidatus Heimdallarchaeota archaeon]